MSVQKSTVMPVDGSGGLRSLSTTDDPNSIEAPITIKAYMMCAFAAFGGIFFGFDSGYINGVIAMPYFIHTFAGLPYPPLTAASDFVLPAWRQSLIVSILSAGTFFGALMSGDFADLIGRRTTIIMGCGIFIVGVILQTASSAYGLLIVSPSIFPYLLVSSLCFRLLIAHPRTATFETKFDFVLLTTHD